MKTINERLYDLYASKWKGLCSAFQPVLNDNSVAIKPTNPMLLYIDKEEEFKNADVRIMIFGQQTYDWNYPSGKNSSPLYTGSDTDIGTIIKCYYEFYCTRHAFDVYIGSFWNGFKKFMKMLGEKYPEKNIQYVWNNIVKIGKAKIGNVNAKGLPPKYICDIEKIYFQVIAEEVRIIKPDIILFLTGTKYENKITDNFGDIPFTALALSREKERELAKVSIPDVNLAFRTYNPGYLCSPNRYYPSIINEINL